MSESDMNRRAFLAAAAAAGIGGLGVGGSAAAQDGPVVPLRGFKLARTNQLREASTALGRTGRSLFRCGFGGYPICELESDEDAVRVVHAALDKGVRYFDTAPSYGDGKSERRIGRAIREYRREGVALDRGELFIATKTLRRDADGARRELEESLKRLGLSYVDSVQCHEVHDDVDSLFGKGAVVQALEKARDEGLVRYIGITGHRNPKWLIDAIGRYPFATALVPVNPFDTHHLSFVREFLPVAREKQVAVVAMKIYGGGFLLDIKSESGGPEFHPGDLLQYALSQEGVAVAVPGCRSVAHVEAACQAALDLPRNPWGRERLAAIEARAGKYLGREQEWYKKE